MANNWKINETVDLQRGIDGIKVWPHALLVTGDENAHEWKGGEFGWYYPRILCA